MAKHSTLAEKIAAKREELRKLEAELRKNLSIGTVVRVLSEGCYGDIKVGSIVKITETNYDDDHEFRCYSLDDSDWDAFRVDQLTPATRDEVREFLWGDVDRKLDEIFGAEVDE